jgi:hypothetical protein
MPDAWICRALDPAERSRSMFATTCRAVRRLASVPILGIAVLSATPAAALVVDIDAFANATTTDGDFDDPSAIAVAISLSAGTWRVEPAGPAAGGAYTAWNAWGGAVGGCEAQGRNCGIGWMHWYRIQSPGSARMRLEDGILYAGAASALANGVGAEFTLPAAQTTYFFIFDTGPDDNVGGVSLRLSQVTAPATLALFGAALAGLAAGQRRRGVGRQSSAASSKPA